MNAVSSLSKQKRSYYLVSTSETTDSCPSFHLKYLEHLAKDSDVDPKSDKGGVSGKLSDLHDFNVNFSFFSLVLNKKRLFMQSI